MARRPGAVGSPLRAGAGDRLAAHLEPAGVEVVAGLERDADRAGEDVALLGGVLAQHLGELARQLRAEALSRSWSFAPSSTMKALGTIGGRG